MTNEYKLPFTAVEIEEKLGKISELVSKSPSDGGAGYCEYQRVHLLPEAQVELTTYDYEECFIQWPAEEAPIIPVSGVKYIVTFDGEEYECIASPFSIADMSVISVGNAGIVGLGKDTGEPFWYAYIKTPEETYCDLSAKFFPNGTNVRTVTIGVDRVDEVVSPISPKFLPAGGVGYTEKKYVVVLPEIEVTLDKKRSPGQKEHDWTIENDGYLPILLKSGQEYVVTLNGTDYRCVARDADLGTPFIYLGNIGLAEGDDNGMPFLYVIFGELATLIVEEAVNNSEPEVVTIGVSQIVENAYRIDGKYLPEGGVGYEEEYEGRITYRFDGDLDKVHDKLLMEAKEDIGGLDLVYFVKLSDNTPPMESMLGATLSYYSSGEMLTIPEITKGDIIDLSGDGIQAYSIGEFVMVFENDLHVDGFSVPAGIYTACVWNENDGSYLYVSELSFYGTETRPKKIDGKFLHQADWSQNDATAPDYVKNRICYTEGKNETVTVTYNGNLDEYVFEVIDATGGHIERMVKVSDQVVDVADCIGASYTVYDGSSKTTETFTVLADDFGPLNGLPIYGPGSMAFMIVHETINLDGLLFTKGVWFSHLVWPDTSDSSGSSTHEKYATSFEFTTHEIVHTIDPKYLPPSSGGSIKIDLAEYGLDVFALFAQGGGEVEFASAPEVFTLAESNSLSDVNFVIKHGDSVYVETKATKVGSGPDNVAGLSAYVPITYDGGNSPLTGNYVLGLFIISQGDEPGLVYLTVEKIGENSGGDINIETVVNEVLNALPTWNGGQY